MKEDGKASQPQNDQQKRKRDRRQSVGPFLVLAKMLLSAGGRSSAAQLLKSFHLLPGGHVLGFNAGLSVDIIQIKS